MVEEERTDMTLFDFIKLILFMLALVILVPWIYDLNDRRQERKAQRERTRWREIQDEHAEHIGHESYRGEKR